MKKILYVVSTLRRSGPTNQLYNLLKYLDRTRFEPYLVTLSPEPADSRWANFEEISVQMESMDLSRLAGVFLVKKKLNKLIHQIRPDLIHSQGIRADIFCTNLNLNIPRVCTVRNIPQQDYPMAYGKLIALLMVWRHVKAMHRLDICVGVSKAVCENLQYAFSLKNVKTVLNGVDTQSYSLAQFEDRVGLRKQLGLPLDGRLWISSGHLSLRKDPFFLIESWKNIFSKNNASNHLIFIGSGPLEKKCMAATKGCRSIHILGRVANVADHLKASDYFISASKSEGLPNAVLEAMACGLPVLLSDIDPHREILAFSEISGQIFRIGDEEGLQEGLSKLCVGNRQEQSAAAIALINDILSAENMTQNYQELYLDLILGDL